MLPYFRFRINIRNKRLSMIIVFILFINYVCTGIIKSKALQGSLFLGFECYSMYLICSYPHDLIQVNWLSYDIVPESIGYYIYHVFNNLKRKRSIFFVSFVNWCFLVSTMFAVQVHSTVNANICNTYYVFISSSASKNRISSFAWHRIL